MQCPDCLAYGGNPHKWWCPGAKKEEGVKTHAHVQVSRCPVCQSYKGNLHKDWCHYRREKH